MTAKTPADTPDTVASGSRAAPADAGPFSVQGVECTDDVCITCSDQAWPAEVIAPPAGPFDNALVRTAAGEESADVSLVGPVSAGDLVLVHAGVAITRLEGSRLEEGKP